MTDVRKVWENYKAELIEMIAIEQQFVDLVDGGKLRTGSREINKEWEDTTSANVARAKRSIEVMQGVIAKIDRDHIG